jgi:hypothetical protein
MRKDRKAPIDGKGAAKSTVSGPRQGPRGNNGDRGAARLRKTQELAARFPFNANKPGEIGEAARSPRAGATAEASDPTVLASTLTESRESPKTGTRARPGINAGNGSLDGVRADSTGMGLTTSFAQPIADNQSSLKAGVRGPVLFEDRQATARRFAERRDVPMKKEELHELLYQALETEQGGVEVYTTALRCVVNEELKTEWEEYLEQTQNHVRIVENLLADMGLDPETETPGRLVVRHIGHALVKAMDMALGAGKPEAAQLVAAECIVLAETKDHLNWELIGELAKKAKGDERRALKEAYDEVEEEEDEHLYHTTGWSRELWIKALGMPAVLPPPEEEKEVKTAIGAARAKRARKDML